VAPVPLGKVIAGFLQLPSQVRRVGYVRSHVGHTPVSSTPVSSTPLFEYPGFGTAVVTGASSGIGAATARHLAASGFSVVLGARRIDQLASIAATCGSSARAAGLDVTVDASVDAFVASVPECRVVVCNAGGALGLDHVERADLDGWRAMFEVNVIGTVRMIKALLPKLEASGDGHIVLMGSIAGLEPYVGGAGYHAAKYPIHAIQQVLRMELLGRPIRITEIDPGMIAGTEFSLVRFDGDAERAASVYAGVTPATAADVADCVAWAVTRPSHVNIDQIVIKPRDQADARSYNR
jgi:NADP-dependent 3-hydroxy acid dehydrogenase YdfG